MKKQLLTLALFCLVLASVVSAGVIQPYWDTHPLEMGFGETKTIEFTLTNVGNQDITYEVVVNKGQEIISVDQTTYTVPALTENTKVPVKITIPEDYNKQVQRIKLMFKVVGEDQGGMVTLTTGYLASFNVVLSEKPIESSSFGLILALVIALIVILVLILVLVKRKK